MKKLFALVLSLALVVAFAVPAMATGWATLETAPVYKDITISVTGLETEPNTVGVGKLYEPLKANANYPVVEGTKLHFLVELTVPYGSLSSATTNLIDNVGLKLAIATSNMTITSCKTNSDSAEKTSAKVTDLFESAAAAKETVVYSYEVWAKALSDDEAKVVATAGFYNEWKEDTMKIFNAKGNLAYTVTKEENGFTVANSDDDSIYFPVDGKMIDTKGILVNDQWLITNGSQNNSIDFYDTTEGNGWASGCNKFNTLNAIYKDIFGFLGFEFAECNYMTADHFELYFGTIGEISASYSWNAGKVVVNPVTPDLPQTGDNASIVGFAMIVVAMVAAAVVTVKKVRA